MRPMLRSRTRNRKISKSENKLSWKTNSQQQRYVKETRGVKNATYWDTLPSAVEGMIPTRPVRSQDRIKIGKSRTWKNSPGQQLTRSSRWMDMKQSREWKEYAEDIREWKTDTDEWRWRKNQTNSPEIRDRQRFDDEKPKTQRSELVRSARKLIEKSIWRRKWHAPMNELQNEGVPIQANRIQMNWELILHWLPDGSKKAEK